jgi:hypothetical protein
MTTTADEWWYSATPPTYYSGSTSGELYGYGFDFLIYLRTVTRDQNGAYVSHTIPTPENEPYWEGDVNSGYEIEFYPWNYASGVYRVSAVGLGYFIVFSSGPGSKSLELVAYAGGDYAQYSFTYVDVETPEPPPANKIPETFWVNVRNAEVT